MMYGKLARYYDALMAHVDYERWMDAVRPYVCGEGLVLDLACGTGLFTECLCRNGYDVIAIDRSEDMLAAAQNKGLSAMFIQQDMTKLDLYGTVGAAFCVLDGMNYLMTPREMQKTLERVCLFLEPGGVFVFDMLTENALQYRGGVSLSSECQEAFCVWQGHWEAPACQTRVTLFAREGTLWRRYEETHAERAYTKEDMLRYLESAGFAEVTAFSPFAEEECAPENQRVFYAAVKPK